MCLPEGDRVWVRLTVRCPPEAADAVATALLGLSPNGTTSDAGSVTAYAGPWRGSRARARALRQARSALESVPDELLPRPLQIETETLAHRDWLETYRAQHRPVRIGRVVVTPSWISSPGAEIAPGEDDVIIELDPGLAFGTGLHPTTQLCVTTMQEHVHRDSRVIDFGCGSGICAIVAARLGAAEVLALDCEPGAVEIARENAARNAVADRVTVRRAEELGGVTTGWDVVVANINPVVVAREAPAARRALRPGGVYICTGVPTGAADDVHDAARAVGFTAIARRVMGEWVAFTCTSPQRRGEAT